MILFSFLFPFPFFPAEDLGCWLGDYLAARAAGSLEKIASDGGH